MQIRMSHFTIETDGVRPNRWTGYGKSVRDYHREPRLIPSSGPSARKPPSHDAERPTRRLTMADVEKVGKKRGPVAGTEEARRGGEAVRKKYGREFYSRIGKKGGDTVRRQHGPDFYANIGRKGGESTKARQGNEFYARIGQKGGKSKRGPKQA